MPYTNNYSNYVTRLDDGRDASYDGQGAVI